MIFSGCESPACVNLWTRCQHKASEDSSQDTLETVGALQIEKPWQMSHCTQKFRHYYLKLEGQLFSPFSRWNKVVQKQMRSLLLQYGNMNYLLRGIQQFSTSTIFALKYGFLMKSGLPMNMIIKFIKSSCRARMKRKIIQTMSKTLWRIHVMNLR